jgi:hypothetical protein
MVEETRRLLHHLVFNDANFMELFTADYSYLSSDLATLYRVPAPSGEFERVTLPADSRRAGLLGHASFLASASGPVETSPTARGIFIREQLLCQHIPPPPPNVNTTLPDPAPDKPSTRRQRLSAHVTNPGCASCHRLMDPIGFGFENFDALGRWRDTETIFVANNADEDNPGPNRRIELPLEIGGEIAGIADSAFTDARQVGRVLAASPICQECVVRQIFRYAYGRPETAADQETIRALTTLFRESRFHFKDLLVGLVRSPEFLRGLDLSKAAAAPRAGAQAGVSLGNIARR